MQGDKMFMYFVLIGIVVVFSLLIYEWRKNKRNKQEERRKLEILQAKYPGMTLRPDGCGIFNGDYLIVDIKSPEGLHIGRYTYIPETGWEKIN